MGHKVRSVEARIGDALPRVGVSSCLLGHAVRYDGKEKRNDVVADRLAREVELVAICPEVGAGMPTPRPPIRVVHREGVRRLVVVDEGFDWSEAMNEFIEGQLLRLDSAPIDAYVFKARSPSCGVHDTPQFLSHHSAELAVAMHEHRSGVWAQALQTRHPNLPVADEEELQDPGRYDAFLAKAFAHFERRRRRGRA